MIPIDDLRRLTSSLTGAEFVRQVGPFVLLQYPDDKTLPLGDERKRTALISKMAVVRLSTEMKTKWPKLHAATLPPIGPNGGMLTIGRAPTHDVVLEDPSASKDHANIVYKNGKSELIDLNSMNGTFINSQPVKPNIANPLRDADVISFGGTQFIFYKSERFYEMLGGAPKP
jgi:hypothetical protein